jgi:hypothetical protein
LTETKGRLAIRQKYIVSKNDSTGFVELKRIYSFIYERVKINSKIYHIESSKFYYVLYVKKINRIKHGDNYRTLVFFNSTIPEKTKFKLIKIHEAELIYDNYYKGKGFILLE